jgi:hypothetical protein
MKKKIRYIGVYPLILTIMIFLIFYFTLPIKREPSEGQIWIFLLFYFSMLIGWGFIYFTTEGWGSKETIIDNKLRNKIIFISMSTSTVLIILIVLFGGSYITLSEIISEWYTIFFYWLLFLGILWGMTDLGIWLKNRNK